VVYKECNHPLIYDLKLLLLFLLALANDHQQVSIFIALLGENHRLLKTSYDKE